MKTETKNRLLRDIAEIILCIAIAVFAWYIVNRHIPKVVESTVKDEIIRSEWVKAAQEVSEPSSVILGAHDCNSK